ncbi:Mediator of RNA polymerase II transcription subunit 11 [Schistosoma japonicum]|uniref:Mediator of RNA polymerase II transcription subunit 11 n=1 Tax=Schistosoma japonicum TaxID=6182 RepID=C1L439_SCHJA|nr:Mediator of RNA polymerase II transcription subunit 11 [Schistosoma japonicum]CAX69467.1 Mediator complex subunit 11 [Schistosoma japonicum]
MLNPSKENQAEASLESRLSKLDEVERKVSLIMQHAGSALEELSKDKPMVKQVESCTHNFRTVIKEVETEMNSHINYLSQISAGLPYEGCTYDQAIDLYQALDRLVAAKRRLDSCL